MRVWPFPIVLLLMGCVDLSAVTKFSQTAPDVTKLDALTDRYVSNPQTVSDWQSVWTTPDPELAQTEVVRESQQTALDGLHALIVNYMKALGGLANSKVTDLSSQAKAVSSNLASLQKAGEIGLSTKQVTSIGDLVTIIPQDVLNIWRGYEIGKLIKHNQVPFQAMIDTEITIVQRYESDYQQAAAVIQDTKGRMDAAILAKPNATARAAHFAFNQDAEEALTSLTTANSAAVAYITALQKLGAAYDILVKDSDHFGADTLQAILPDINDAQKAYSDMRIL